MSCEGCPRRNPRELLAQCRRSQLVGCWPWRRLYETSRPLHSQQMKLTPAEIRAVIGLAVGMFCVQVDFFALNLALPRMAVDLNETTTDMQWVISA